VIGADRHERTEQRLGYRNGYRSRSLTTQVGDIDLLIPKLRAGSFLPSILEPRRRVDQALYAVIMEAYISGVSTRKVDALVGALGSQSGISKSQVSRICQEIDQQVQAFLNRPLQEAGYAYIYLDATYLHGRLGKALQVCSRADVLAYSCGEDFVYYFFTQQHWKKVWSTNLLERVNVAPRDELCEADHKAPV
jgi:transposase-like protein